MTNWGICVLSSNSVPQVLAFVAHHLELGASRIHVFFDRPEDPAAALLEDVPGVAVTRCDDVFWQALLGERPERHQDRQLAVVGKTYKDAGHEWLLHIDIDEFVVPAPIPVSTILQEVPAWQQTLRMTSLEALPGNLPAGNRIYRSTHFRGILPDDKLRQDVFGPFATSLRNGILSHVKGKSFFRTGVPGLKPDIHIAKFDDGSNSNPQAFHPLLQMVHFHADDRDEWVANAHRRAKTGAYRVQPALKRTLLALDEAGLHRFHQRVHANDGATLRKLAAARVLLELDLELEAKVNALPIDFKVPEPMTDRPSQRRSFFAALFGRKNAA